MTLIQLGWQSFFDKHFQPFSAEFRPARVAVQQVSVFELLTETGECLAEMTGKLRLAAESEPSLRPVVGDWVAVKPVPGEAKAMIHSVLPRRTKFSRKVTGELTGEQIVAANIDVAMIVCGLDGDYNLRRIERYLTTVEASGAAPVVVLNKSDACDDPDARVSEVRSLSPTTPVFAVSALQDRGLDALAFYLEPGKTGCLVGSSGVGKSTLINALLGAGIQKTKPVMEGRDRGRHTTTSRELFALPGGAFLIDTPGMRELQLWVDEADLDRAFADIETLAARCRFRDCQHVSEPECAVRSALEDGTLDPARYRNYLKMLREIRYLELRQDTTAARLEKMRWKKIHADMKKQNRMK